MIRRRPAVGAGAGGWHAGPDKAMYWSESHFNTIGRYDLVTGRGSVIGPLPSGV